MESRIRSKIGSYQESTSKSYVIIGALLATIISISFLVAGIYLVIRNDPYTADTMVTIVSSTCTPVTQGSQSNGSQSNEYSCDIRYQYIVNGVTYADELTIISAKQYTVNDTVRIQYIPSDPQDTRLYQTPPLIVGSGLIATAIIATALAWGIVWISHRFIRS